MKIRKVIIPAAGFGTRFLPQTKSLPKEMLPIVDKPIIQYVVEEAVSAGIEDVIIVTGAHKRSIEDHFDYNYELDKRLEEWGKEHWIDPLKSIADMANFIYVRQKGPYGNATPIKCAKHLVGDEPFLVLWGDDFVKATPERSQQMVDAYDAHKGTILCCIRTNNPEDTNKYGFIEGEEVKPGLMKVKKLIEKPGPGKAPSNLAVVSGFLLTPGIFPILETQKPGKGGEFYLTEAINELAQIENVYALEIQNGKFYDTGNKLEYLKTVVEFALAHEELGEDFSTYLKDILK